jgi:hypothetical protein
MSAALASKSESEPDPLPSREEVDDLMEKIKSGRESPDVRAEIDRELDRASGEVWGVKRALSRGKLSGQQKALVDKHVDKYMAMLKIDGERPDVRVSAIREREQKVRDGQEGYVAGATHWHPLRPYTSLIRLQETLFKRPLQLESTIAHELVHHRNNLAISDDEIKNWLATGEPPAWWAENDGHGKAFRDGAERINAIMGSDYVMEEGGSTAEDEEEERVIQTEKARSKKIHFGKQILFGIGGGVLLVLALRKVFPRGLRPASSPEGKSPSDRGPLPGSSPEHGKKAPPISRMGSVPVCSTYANERGSYGPPRIQRFTSANERGSYGRSRNQRSTP